MSGYSLLFTGNKIVGYKVCRRDVAECREVTDPRQGNVGGKGVVERGEGNGMGPGWLVEIIVQLVRL